MEMEMETVKSLLRFIAGEVSGLIFVLFCFQVRASQEIAENQPGRENVQEEVNREDEANDEEQAAAVSRTQPGVTLFCVSSV